MADLMQFLEPTPAPAELSMEPTAVPAVSAVDDLFAGCIVEKNQSQSNVDPFAEPASLPTPLAQDHVDPLEAMEPAAVTLPLAAPPTSDTDPFAAATEPMAVNPLAQQAQLSATPAPAGSFDVFMELEAAAPLENATIAIMEGTEKNMFREWEQKHEKDLEDAAQKEVRLAAEKRQNAQTALQQFYENEKAMREKRKEEGQLNLAHDAALLDSTSTTENPWERVVSLVDLNSKGDDRDLGRMKQMMIHLKASPPKPNSTK